MSDQKLPETESSPVEIEELHDQDLDNVQGGAKATPTSVSKNTKLGQGIKPPAPKGMERVFEDE